MLVLAAGLLTFRREMLHITDNELDPLCQPVHGMYELSGELRAYQGQAVVGERVFVSPRAEGKHLEGKFAYLDALSLYPSAIFFVCEKPGGYHRSLRNALPSQNSSAMTSCATRQPSSP